MKVWRGMPPQKTTPASTTFDQRFGREAVTPAAGVLHRWHPPPPWGRLAGGGQWNGKASRGNGRLGQGGGATVTDSGMVKAHVGQAKAREGL